MPSFEVPFAGVLTVQEQMLVSADRWPNDPPLRDPSAVERQSAATPDRPVELKIT